MIALFCRQRKSRYRTVLRTGLTITPQNCIWPSTLLKTMEFRFSSRNGNAVILPHLCTHRARYSFFFLQVSRRALYICILVSVHDTVPVAQRLTVICFLTFWQIKFPPLYFSPSYPPLLFPLSSASWLSCAKDVGLSAKNSLLPSSLSTSHLARSPLLPSSLSDFTQVPLAHKDAALAAMEGSFRRETAVSAFLSSRFTHLCVLDAPGTFRAGPTRNSLHQNAGSPLAFARLNKTPSASTCTALCQLPVLQTRPCAHITTQLFRKRKG